MLNWLEIFTNSTAGFDRSFVDNVIDSVMFDSNDGDSDVEWFTFQYVLIFLTGIKWRRLTTLQSAYRGGSRVLIESMLSRIRTKPQTNKRVTALGMASGNRRDQSLRPQVFVKVENEPIPRLCDHVISTLPFGCFCALDTDQLSMPYTVQQAIQALQYCSGVKIAMRFATRWWERLGHKGGTSITDRPALRWVVYPSYGIGSEAATIIVSYTWAQDASRLDAFVKGSTVDPYMRDAILRDLAEMHSITFEYLRDEYRELHAWSWGTSEFSVGQSLLYTLYAHIINCLTLSKVLAHSSDPGSSNHFIQK